MSIYAKLSAIQAETSVPKGQYNSFGKYKYRSCEDILAAVKPVASKHGCVLVVGDEIWLAGNRHYIKATARLVDIESNEEILNTAFAREEEEKKGMDGSQITGTASSYARKYALNGLLGLDDIKDADTDENRNERDSKADKRKEPDAKPEGDIQRTREILFGLGRTLAKCDNTPESIEAADKRTRDFAEKVYDGYTFDQLTVDQLNNVKVALLKKK